MPEDFRNPPDNEIRAILDAPRAVAVVGCSPDPGRDSYRIARLLLERGHRVIPVGMDRCPAIEYPRLFGTRVRGAAP